MSSSSEHSPYEDFMEFEVQTPEDLDDYLGRLPEYGDQEIHDWDRLRKSSFDCGDIVEKKVTDFDFESVLGAENDTRFAGESGIYEEDKYLNWAEIEREFLLEDSILTDSEGPDAFFFPQQSTSSSTPENADSSAHLEGPSVNPRQQHSTVQRSSPPSSIATEEVYACPHKPCTQVFKRSNALHRHVSSIHGRNGEICPFCRNNSGQRVRRFNRSDNFQRHVTSQHKEVGRDDERLLECLKRLYQGDGKRTCWRKSP